MGADLDLRIVREIDAGAPGDVRLDLVGDDAARRPDEAGEDRGVIARARADLHHRLALFRAQRVDAERMQRRLAVVDAPLRVDRHQHVVVEAGEVIFALRKEAAAGDMPGRRTGKILARHGGESLLDPPVAHAGAAGDVGGVAPAKRGGSVWR